MPSARPISPAKSANPTGLAGAGVALTVPLLPEFKELGGTTGVAVASLAGTSMAASGLWISFSWHWVHVFRSTTNVWLCWALPMPSGASVLVM